MVKEALQDCLADGLLKVQPSDRCLHTCGRVGACVDKSMADIWTDETMPCSIETTAIANCIVTELVEALSVGPSLPPCQCGPPHDDDHDGSPAAPSTSLGLDASVLKKNLRA